MGIQRVEPTALTSQAAEMKGQNWHNPAAEAVAPPDALPATAAAIANLNDNAQSLLGYQRWAEVENTRIAEMLEIAAQAYEKVDATYGTAIEDPDRRAAVEAISVPAPSTPPAAVPPAAGAPRLLGAGGYSDVHKTQADLVAGDHGVSLKTAMLQWGVAATRIGGNAPRPPAGDWEGEAADAAYARTSEFGAWLQQLAAAWRELATAAAKVVEAHDKARAEHDGIHSEYVSLEQQLRQLAAQATVGNSVATQREMEKIQKRMQELQQRSDEVRQEYASSAAFAPVQPGDPPAKGADATTTAGGSAGAGGTAATNAGGHRPSGDRSALADEMGSSLGGQPSGAGAPPSAPSGGGAPSGAPSGGGAPPGGGAGAGMPGGLPAPGPSSGGPKLPTDSRLRPAAAGGGGSSGGVAGGGGGGMPATPMSAPVSAETVAPAPTSPAASATQAAAPGGSAPGGMGGGMAPMGHGAGAHQGKEKRRDPRLAPDEELYTEDRPWTEAVIGNRRRRDVQDGKDAR